MSHLARGPRSGIDSKANAAGGRHEVARIAAELSETDRMSHLARGPHSGIDSNASGASHRPEAAGATIPAEEVAT
ncbi:MAG: hypothetical protein WAK92_07495 [Thiobacillus sp.]